MLHILQNMYHHTPCDSLGSVAGSAIQATRRTDFVDGSRTETKLEVRNGLQSIRTIPEVNMVNPSGAGHDPRGGAGA